MKKNFEALHGPRPTRLGSKPGGPVMNAFWTPKKTARLLAEWIAGTPVQEIADLLRGSRNAIIGKAHRMKLPIHAGSLFHPDALKKSAEKRAEKRAEKIREGKRAGRKLVRRKPMAKRPEADSSSFVL